MLHNNNHFYVDLFAKNKHFSSVTSDYYFPVDHDDHKDQWSIRTLSNDDGYQVHKNTQSDNVNHSDPFHTRNQSACHKSNSQSVQKKPSKESSPKDEEYFSVLETPWDATKSYIKSHFHNEEQLSSHWNAENGRSPIRPNFQHFSKITNYNQNFQLLPKFPIFTKF